MQQNLHDLDSYFWPRCCGVLACLLTRALPDPLLQVKGLFDKLGVPFKAIDLDTIGKLNAADTAPDRHLASRCSSAVCSRRTFFETGPSNHAAPRCCCVAVEGDDIRDALAELTESHTVPQVFIGGEFIGGCDGEGRPALATNLNACASSCFTAVTLCDADTMQLNSSGKLAEKLEAAGVAAKA